MSSINESNIHRRRNGSINSKKAPQSPTAVTVNLQKDAKHTTVIGEDVNIDNILNTSLLTLPRPSKDPRMRHWHPELMKASTDTHLVTTPSILSMGQQPDFRGFLNLAGVALVVMNIRLVIENLMKYGILFSVSGDISSNWSTSWPSLVVALLVGVLSPTTSWAIEYARYTYNVSSSLCSLFHVVHIITIFFGSLSFIWITKAALASAFLLAFVCVISTLKLISYAHVSNDIAKVRDVLVFSNGPIIPCDRPEEVIASEVFNSVRNQYIHTLRRIQQEALTKLAIYETGDDTATSNMVQSNVKLQYSKESKEQVLESIKHKQSHDKNSTTTTTTSSSSSRSNPSCTLLFTHTLQENVTAIYTEEGDTVVIDLVGLPQLQDKITYVKKPYVPSFSHAWYFYLCPTLVFQPSYPRSSSIRVGFILRRLMELVFISIILLFMADQYVKPTLFNSIAHVKSLDILALTERVLKLAVPNLFMWLLIFYGIFHSYLNLVAELMCFGDRVFYKDWWNAPDMGVYWRTWNRPVHDWLAKHVYCVCTRHGISSTAAKILVFFVSALLHEVLISIPCHMIGYYAFMGMFLQVPSIYISTLIYKKVKNQVLGNVLFWLTLPVVGQPVLILLYFYQYYISHGL